MFPVFDIACYWLHSFLWLELCYPFLAPTLCSFARPTLCSFAFILLFVLFVFVLSVLPFFRPIALHTVRRKGVSEAAPETTTASETASWPASAASSASEAAPESSTESSAFSSWKAVVHLLLAGLAAVYSSAKLSSLAESRIQVNL